MASQIKEEQTLEGIQAELERIQAQIPGITAGVAELTQPIDADQLETQTGNFNVPELPGTTPDLSTAESTLAGYRATIDSLMKSAEVAKEQQLQLQEQQQTNVQKFFDSFLGKPTIAEQRTALEQQLGVSPAEFFAGREADVAEVQSMMEQYNKSVEAKNLALSETRARVAPEEFITRIMTRQERDANIRLNAQSARINTKMGIMEMQQQNFTDANQFINQAVQDYTAEQRLKVEEFQMFYDVNRETINDLGKQHQDLFDKSFELAKTELATRQNELNQVFDWITRYPEAAWPTDISQLTVAEAAKIASQRPTTAMEGPTSFKEFTLAGGETGTGMTYAQWLQRKDTEVTRSQVTDLQRNLDNIATQMNAAGKDASLVDVPAQFQPYLIQVQDLFSPTGFKWQALKVTEQDFRGLEQFVPTTSPSVGDEFEEDFRLGMPYEDALTLYGAELGEDFVNSRYEVGQFTPAPQTTQEKATLEPAEEELTVGVESGTEEYFENLNKKIQDFLKQPLKLPELF